MLKSNVAGISQKAGKLKSNVAEISQEAQECDQIGNQDESA